ncbi:MAG: alpha/beta hydrolase [candidate division Zixibacteria bacterium]
MPFYDANDAAIYYEIEGKGRPLVLLHGYALNGIMWELQSPALAKNNTIITVDLRGFGKSSCGKNWSGTIMADDVKGLIKSLDLSDVAVLGFSLSGPAAFRIALDIPQIITSLIMVSSILPSAGRPKAKKEAEFHRKERDMLRLRGPEAWAEGMGLWKGPLVNNIFKRNPDARPVWERMIVRHNPDYLLSMMTARDMTPSLVNWRSRLGEISVPALIVAGAQDSGFIDSAHYLNRNIPNSQLEIINGAGHMVNLESPEEFNKVLSGFLI